MSRGKITKRCSFASAPGHWRRRERLLHKEGCTSSRGAGKLLLPGEGLPQRNESGGKCCPERELIQLRFVDFCDWEILRKRW